MKFKETSLATKPKKGVAVQSAVAEENCKNMPRHNRDHDEASAKFKWSVLHYRDERSLVTK